MSTGKVTLSEARQLLDIAQRNGDILGQTTRGFTYWLDKYADNRTAWHHGILHHLRSWLELNEEATAVSLHSPEMATALGEFAERMLDLN